MMRRPKDNRISSHSPGAAKVGSVSDPGSQRRIDQSSVPEAGISFKARWPRAPAQSLDPLPFGDTHMRAYYLAEDGTYQTMSRC